MDKAIKKLWVRELRSGAWIQARGTLFNNQNGSFCCLGVLREICYRRKAWEIEGTYRMASELKIGLGKNAAYELVDLNDAKHCTFSEIADYIEANL